MQQGNRAPRSWIGWLFGRTCFQNFWLILGLLFGLHPGLARADGISLLHIKLPELTDRARVALMVTVTAKEGPKGFKARVTRVWQGGEPVAWSVGTAYTFVREQEPPAEPGKWVIVRRYWDNLPLSLIPGQELILIPDFNSKGSQIAALIKKTPYTITKLNLLFKAGWQEAYRKGASIRELERDLSDFDLFEEAHGALLHRGKLKDQAVIQAAARARPFDLVEYHLGKILSDVRDRFILALVRYLIKHPSERLTDLVRRHFDRGTLQRDELPALILFLNHLLDRKRGESTDALYYLNNTILRYLKQPRGKRAAPRFMPYFARYAPLRPHAGGGEEQITDYAALLSPKLRARLALELMKGPMKNSRGELDYLSLTLALDQRAALPPARLLAFLKRVHPLVDPDSFNGCEEVQLLIKSVLLLSSKRPRMRKQLTGLARALHSQYNCNVDQATKQQLGELAGINP